MSKKTALVLSGGGARGAYQAGVLKGVSELISDKSNSPFQIISGVSAGAINSAKLACDMDSFPNAVEKMNYLWSQLTHDQVFKTDFLSLNKLPMAIMSGKSLSVDSLLDTTPLKALLKTHCDFGKIKTHLADKRFESLIITANNYNSGSAVSFVQTNTANLTWKESRRVAKLAEIDEHHIMASSAIPLLFPPIKIDSHYYGDGCIRNNTPCSPSIRMGAEKLFVIGVRTQLNAPIVEENHTVDEKTPSFVRIINTLLNAVLLDSVEQDVYRIQKINQLTELVKEKRSESQFKKIPALCISPSEDIGQLARQHAHRLPRLIRLTLSTFGTLDEASEILSYLLFDPHFCRKLIDMGYNDAMASKEQILNFFKEDN